MPSATKTGFKGVGFTRTLSGAFGAIKRNKMAFVGFCLLTIFLLMAILGPILLSPPKSDYYNRLQPPTLNHILGTDFAGKDTLTQLVLGARDVLLVAAIAAAFSITIACAVGILAGHLGGKVDGVLMMIANIVITIPSFPITMIMSMVIKVTNPLTFGILLGMWSWAGLSRAIRSRVLTIKHKEFIEASKIMGMSTLHIVVSDIFPNIVSYVAINFISVMKGAIMSSVGLIYLGLVPFTGNHWGVMLRISMAESGALYGSGAVVYFLAPVSFIILFQLGCYWFATGLDEALNPRLRT